MTLMVSMDVIKNGNTCEPAVAELIKYFQENNISEISFDDVIAHWKLLGRRDWAIWAYQNKKVFEQLVNYNVSQEEITADEAQENYLNSLNLIGYRVNNVDYSTLEDAQNARQQQLANLKDEMEPLVVCNLEVIDANGDATWTIVDLDNLDLPTNANVKIFNPTSGQYVSCTTLEEAILKRNEFIVLVSDSMNGSARIAKVMSHPDFPNEQILNYEF